jgi:hypothetical protein
MGDKPATAMHELPRDPSLDQLDALAGEWTTEATHPLLPGIIRGKATLEWLEGKRFLVWRSDNPPGTVPRAIAVIGGGETPGVWPMHYFDERGVMRVYQVSMDGGVWRVWRDHSGFLQRFSGVFDDGGRTLCVNIELDQGEGWKPDLQMTYRRA